MSDTRCNRDRQQQQQPTDEDKSPAIGSSAQAQDDSEPGVTYAVVDKPYRRDENCYANVPQTDNNAVIYSEVRRRPSKSNAVPPPDEQYANLPQ